MNRVRSSASMLDGMVPYDPKYLQADVMISANESTRDIPEGMREAVMERLGQLAFNRYPDPLATHLRELTAAHWGVRSEQVLLGNGGDELLFDLLLAWGGPGRALLNFPPTFSVYATNARLTGTKLVELPRSGERFDVDIDVACERVSRGDVDLVVLTSPNNPTGCSTANNRIEQLLDASDALVLVDEAYADFADTSCLELLDKHENLLVLRTFSKAYRMAGVRLGYFIGNESVISEFKKVRQPYSVDALSQVVGEECIAHAGLFAEAIAETRSERERMVSELNGIEGVHAFPSDANFVLFSVEETGLLASEVWKRLLEGHSVLVRDVSGDELLTSCLRVSVGVPEENDRFVSALRSVLAEV